MEQDRQLVLAELEDRVEKLFAGIDGLRENPGDGRTRRESLDSIFRTIHSLKASVSTLGWEDLTRLAHEFEGLLHSLRIGRTTLSDTTLQAFDETADALLAGLDRTKAIESVNLLDRLKRLSDPVAGGFTPTSFVPNGIPAEVWHSLTEEEKYRLEESVRDGASLFLVTTAFTTANFDLEFQALKDILIRNGELISTAPMVDRERPEIIDFRILYTCEANLDQLQRELSTSPNVLVSELLSASDFVPGQRILPPTWPKSFPPPLQPLKSIRINLEDLDRLIASAQKLQREANNSLEGVADVDATRVSRLFTELVGDIVNLRLVSIDRVMQRAIRAGRAAAHTSGKQVDFTVSGKELLLDKSLCDALADPLIHLVRNAVDYGIENPQDRVRAKKQPHGAVHLKASASQGQIRITVSDDGRGIDPEVVSNAAKNLGVIDVDRELTLEQSVRLIFRPGFSTAISTSDISGRGVGLDVVETTIEDAGGDVRVNSAPGTGSSFEIRLPITFGLLDVRLVKSGTRSYLIDNNIIVTNQTVKRNDVTANRLSFSFENSSIPVFRLRSLLEATDTEPEERDSLSLIVCSVRKDQFSRDTKDQIGIVVEVAGEVQKLLVRSLGSHGGRWRGVTGAAELHDGSVALLLDLPGLLARHAHVEA